MIVPVLLLLLQALAHVVVASECRNPTVRYEWRELSHRQQRHFIEALACLKRLPSKFKGPLEYDLVSPSRYDDVALAHFRVRTDSSVNELRQTHNSANFLPWHRLYLYAFEKILKEECRYTEGLPDWDWTVDASSPEGSLLWSNASFTDSRKILGFGRDGKYHEFKNTFCLRDGPFNHWNITFYPPVCLQRDFGGREGEKQVDMRKLKTFITKEGIAKLMMESTTYDSFRNNLESTVHGAVHQAVGGTMSVIAASSNDPIFWLHHANIDRLWSVWQARYMEKNPNRPIPYDGLLADKKTRAYKYDRLELSGMYPALDKLAQVGRMLDTQSGHPLCYKYSNSIVAGPRFQAAALYTTNISSIAKDPTLEQLFRAHDKYEFGVKNGISPDEQNRKDKKRMRCPTRLSHAMIKQLMYSDDDLITIRKKEQSYCCFVNYINYAHKEYTSASALGRVKGVQTFHSLSDEEVVQEARTLETLYDLYRRADVDYRPLD